eukprot:SAG11_NODE_796_length_7130_cov_57.915375_1_plen_59_part_00
MFRLVPFLIGNRKDNRPPSYIIDVSAIIGHFWASILENMDNITFPSIPSRKIDCHRIR